MARSRQQLDDPPAPATRLHWTALALCLGAVLARATIQQSLRDPFRVTPGSTAAPRAAGAAGGIALDLIGCLPAILVLVRRLSDRSFRLRTGLSFLPLLALCGWMLLSTVWAADKFAALLTGFHWVAAAALLWAASQLVRTWVDLRFIAAVSFALLPVYVIETAIYQFQDLPALRKYFQENKAKTLAESNLVEGTFGAEFFERKLNAGDTMGFFQSSNTFGAAVSLLLILGTGLLIQHVVDRDARKWALPTAGGLLLAGGVVLLATRSRGAAATLALCLLALLVIGTTRDRLARAGRKSFIAGVAIVVFTCIAVVGHGLYHGSLPTTTLTFRWHYWVGGARVFASHPFLGVGWDNFGLNYLSHRLPRAPEEVKDPHNLIVRFFAELGLVGGVLFLGWLTRLWWELTRPSIPTPVEAVPPLARFARPAAKPPGVLGFVAAAAGVASLIELTGGVDWLRDSPENFLLKRLLFCAATVITAALLALRSVENSAPDDRPAPWVLYAMILAAAGFLVHNLIDFSLFEPGPMWLFALLTGSVLGMRGPHLDTGRARTGWVAASLLAGAAALVATAMLVWAPTISAESAADNADELMRGIKLTDAQADDPPQLAKASIAATISLDRASAGQPLDAEYALRAADYAFRAARLLPAATRGELAADRTGLISAALQDVNQSIARNPLSAFAHTLRAQIRLSGPAPDAAAARQDLLDAIAIDPNSVELRLSVADLLAASASPVDKALARKQYQEALRYDSLLAPDEPKRLTPTRIAEIQAKLARL